MSLLLSHADVLSYSLIIRGYKKPLQKEDLYDLNDGDKVGTWVPDLERHWILETEKLIRSAVNMTLRSLTDRSNINESCKLIYTLTLVGLLLLQQLPT